MATNTGTTLGMSKNYNENSSKQLAVINSMKPYIYLGIDHLNISPTSSRFIIADFGSSHGHNSIQAIKIIIQYLQQSNKLSTSPLVIHNDLPTNDWTTLFQLLAEDNSYHGVANGHSFYQQCLPSNCVSIGFSSTSIHWLSRIPCQISNYQFYTLAAENERQKFKQQAKLDFDAFIEHRARELVPGGIFILSIPGVDHQGIVSVSRYFELLYTCAQLLFNTKELADFTLPVYFRSLSECIDHALFDRCSLQLIKAELGEVEAPALQQYRNRQLSLDQLIKTRIKAVQSSMELSLQQVLENNDRSKEEIDRLLIEFWTLYETKLREQSHLFISDKPSVYGCLILKKIKVIDN
ncbi:unnamed protein product [Rotaria sordida]|uniref:Uncharacterized protein n=1 Tax=Rotaria sordida TaxID=392033 RepID=A0A815X633_9BILA|nr:unnamed protein product [Rotaria sordida]CAF1673671.1 unnamed protein product [Rotaria sordida]